jgi:hypothetical protein
MTGCGTLDTIDETWLAVRKDPLKMIGVQMDVVSVGPPWVTSTSGSARMRGRCTYVLGVNSWAIVDGGDGKELYLM